MKVNPGAKGSPWVPAGCTGHCRWETDGVKSNELIILSFFPPCLPKLAAVLWKNDSMVQWISFLCVHSSAVTARSPVSFSLCNFEVFNINAEKVNLLLLTFHSFKALVYLYCNKTVVQLSEPALRFNLFVCIMCILSGIVWTTLSSAMLWKKTIMEAWDDCRNAGVALSTLQSNQK